MIEINIYKAYGDCGVFREAVIRSKALPRIGDLLTIRVSQFNKSDNIWHFIVRNVELICDAETKYTSTTGSVAVYNVMVDDVDADV